ncbi:MAG TPA: hypothetical protein VIQ30_27345, partial [Pseudonocardia sp.]
EHRRPPPVQRGEESFMIAQRMRETLVGHLPTLSGGAGGGREGAGAGHYHGSVVPDPGSGIALQPGRPSAPRTATYR